MKIVLIEDYEAARVVFYYHLIDKGYDIEVYNEPDERTLSKIISDIESERPLLLLIDYKLPIMDALDTIVLLKKASSKLKLDNTYILTNYPGLVDQQKLKSVGCRLALKPATLDEIDSFILEALESLTKNLPETTS